MKDKIYMKNLDLNKIHKLLEYAGRTDDVADPWYSRRFDIAYQDIYEGCTGLLEYLKAQGI